jgi:hypothetical protein
VGDGFGDLDGLVRLGLRTWAPAGADGAVAGMLRAADRLAAAVAEAAGEP